MATKEQLAALAETQSELSASSGTVGAPSGLRKPSSDSICGWDHPAPRGSLGAVKTWRAAAPCAQLLARRKETVEASSSPNRSISAMVVMKLRLARADAVTPKWRWSG